MNTLNDVIIWFYRVSACIVTFQCIKRIQRQNVFNIEWNTLLINTSYNAIFIYSKLQLSYVKMKNKLFPMLLLISNSTCKILHKYNVLPSRQKINQLDFYNFGKFIGTKQITHEPPLAMTNIIKTELESVFSKKYNYII